MIFKICTISQMLSVFAESRCEMRAWWLCLVFADAEPGADAVVAVAVGGWEHHRRDCV